MNEYLIRKDTLTEIGNKVRRLSGDDEALSPVEMAEGLENVADEVDTQFDLIQQIKTALADKAAGVELPELSNPAEVTEVFSGAEYIDNNGLKRTGTFTIQNELTQQDDLIAQIQVALEGKTAGGMELPMLESPGTASDLAQGKELIDANGNKITGLIPTREANDERWIYDGTTSLYTSGNEKHVVNTGKISDSLGIFLKKDSYACVIVPCKTYGDATAADVRQGKTFTSKDGLKIEGTALIPGGGFVYPDGAFMPVTSFTDGKQYALVAVIDGVHRYINTTTYNNYTMNATQITISEDAGDYVIFSNTPVMFTAVASGDGFLLQNGSNYLHGTSSGGTALRVGTTQMIWTVDNSTTGGFSDGKYYAKEDPNAVWLMSASGGYNWSIKYETAGSFGYDRNGRDNTYSTGFTPFVLYEYIAGEGTVSPVVDTSDANVTADKMLAGYSGYANGRKVNGNIELQTKTATANGTVTPDSGKYLSSVTVNVPTGITPSGTLNITQNGTHNVTNYASVNVNVASGYVSGDVVNAKSISLTFGSGYGSISVTYGTSIVNTNGTLSLGDSSSVSASSASDLDIVKGKYVLISSTIYYIPTDANISYSGNNLNKSYTTDKASPVFVIA